MSTRSFVLLTSLWLGAATCTAGCFVYEPPHVHDEDAGVDGDAGEEGAHLELSDVCDPMATPLEPADEHLHASLTGLESDVDALSACGATDLRGPDGFVKLHLGAGERWHIAAEPSADMDIAMYLLGGGCDPRGVDCRLFIDRCPAGIEEELTLSPSTAQTLFLGFDTHGSTEEFEALITRTRCGDGVEDHGEGCDDGNVAAGDGCDPTCRVELLAARNPEAEPNDVHAEANVIPLPTGASTEVTGQVGGLCDQDHFAVDVQDGAELQVEVLAPDGGACAAGTPGTMLMLMNPRDGVVMSQQGGECPTLTTTLATGGEYHVMFMAQMTGEGAPTIPYTLRLTVNPPP